MTQIKLLNMKIRNFKGVTNYELNADGQDINVQGDNGTGKTTLYDAFLWCLFGKNSADQATFDWKPLDKLGNEINHLETEVIVELEIDGKVKKLSRMRKENWVKKRGSATEVFDGNPATYRLDDLIVNKKDFDEYLSTLIDENLFKVLTDVAYFSDDKKMERTGAGKTTPGWKVRREMLINMVGDVTDADVIKENRELEPLKELIEERPADDLKQLTKQQMNQISKDIKAIPNRIDEVDRSLPDISKLDKDVLLKDKESHENIIKNLQEQIATVKNSDSVVKARNKIAELRIYYKEMELEYNEELEKGLEDVSNEKELIETEIRETNAVLEKVQDDNSMVERAISRKEQEVKELESDRERLLGQFYEIRDRQMEDFETHQTSCPTCGQDLPEENLLNIRAAYEQEIEVFNSNKALDLKENKEKGVEIAGRIKELQGEIEKLNSGLRTDLEVIEETKKDKERLTKKLKEIESSIAKIREGQNPFEETEKAKEIKDEAAELQKQIDSGESNVDKEVEEINKEIEKARSGLSNVTEQLSEIDFHARQSKRREELIQQEQELSVKYGELEQQQYLLEEFTRTKVSLLTDTINSRFKLVKFKLFEEQINGGLKEVCEVTMDGANYSTGLNNAARINAGLDIINTLMAHYDVYVPVWVDNSESVNELIDIETQLITLSVTKHKNLKVESV